MRRALMFSAFLAFLLLSPSVDAAQLERWPLPGRNNPSWAVGGSDGAVWFTANAGVGRVAPDGRVTLFRVPGPEVVDLTPGRDGALYGTVLEDESVYGDRVVRVDMDGSARMVAFKGSGHGITKLAPGPENDLWALQEVPMAVTRMTTSGAVVSSTRLPRGVDPLAMATAPDGSLVIIFTGGFGRVSVAGRLSLTKVDGFGVGSGLAAMPDGAVWATPYSGRRLVRIAPDDTVQRIALGVAPAAVAPGPDGGVWFSFWAPGGGVGRVGADGHGVQLWREPFGTEGPDSLAFDGAGNLWGTAFGEYSLERLALAAPPPPAGPLEPFLPRRGLLRRPYQVYAGIAGAMWFVTESGVVRADPTGAHRLFNEGPARDAFALLPDEDGGVWMASGGRGVARIAPDGGIRRYARMFRKGAEIFAIAQAVDGALWVLDAADETVARWTPGGRVRRIVTGLGRRRDLLTITRGPDDRMWITDQGGAVLAISAAGRVQRYTRGLGRRPEPTAITAGPDGNLWFTMFARRRVGRITPAGHVRLWRTREAPASIQAGPDEALWFTTAAVSLDDTINGLGRIDPRGRRQEFFVRGSRTTGYQALTAAPDGKIWFVLNRGPIAVARMDPQRVAEIGVIAGG